MGIFHAYDIRAIYPDDLNEEIAYRVGYFLPSLLDTKKMIVGFDTRLSSKSLYDSLVKGITESGCDVISLGLSTTPFVYFATAHLGECSVQITASHNPKEYNGFKISRKGALPVGGESGLKELEKLVMSNKETKVSDVVGKVESVNLYKEYEKYLSSFLSDISNLSISFDLSSGMSNLFAKDLFTSKNNHFINDKLDGSFPSHEPNPLDEKNCAMLKSEVLKNKSDIGVIYDGDADRVVFVDDKGRFIQPDYITSLIGYYYKNIKGQTSNAVVDIRTSKSTTEYLESIGFNPIIWKVGHSFAKLKIRENDALFGGELAGHYYFKEFFWCDSGLFASILVLNTVSQMKKEGKTLSQFIDNLVVYKNSGECNFKINNKDKAIEEIKNKYLKDAIKVYDFDGYRLEFKDWWFSVRKSNTEPYLRLIVEGTSKDILDKNYNDLKSIIENADK